MKLLDQLKARSSFTSQRRQDGSILLEVLIAFVILAGGLLVVFRFHNTTMGTAAQAKITAEATALAEAKLEQVRGFVGTVDYLALMTNGAGLGEYAGTDFVGSFTRQWAVNQNPYPAVTGEPWEINVTVSWTDRNNQPQNVSLRSAVLGQDPSTGAGLLATAVHGGSDPIDGWVDHDPTKVGTGYGGGKVTIKYKGADGLTYDSQAAALDAGTTVVSVTVYFTGTIESVDGGKLVDVALDGTPVSSGTACQVDAAIGGVATVFDPLAVDGSNNPLTFKTWHFTSGPYALSPDGGLKYNGAWRDSSGAIVSDPYLYSCVIADIPLNETWQGTITYTGEQGVKSSPDDVVCIPNQGTTTLAFSAASPETLQLGIVLVDKKNLCNLFK